MQFSEKPSELHAPDAIQLISVFAIIRACLKLHKRILQKINENVLEVISRLKRQEMGGWGGRGRVVENENRKILEIDYRREITQKNWKKFGIEIFWSRFFYKICVFRVGKNVRQ